MTGLPWKCPTCGARFRDEAARLAHVTAAADGMGEENRCRLDLAGALRRLDAARENAATAGLRWRLLSEWLVERIDHDDAVHRGYLDDGDMALAAPYGGLLSANRSTLAEMREMADASRAELRRRRDDRRWGGPGR